MVRGDVKNDGAGLEQRQLAFLVGRDLAKRVEMQMRRLLHRSKRHGPYFVGQTGFQRPPYARVARSPLPPSGERSNAVIVIVMLVSWCDGTPPS
jgi:hypothetical protein